MWASRLGRVARFWQETEQKLKGQKGQQVVRCLSLATVTTAAALQELPPPPLATQSWLLVALLGPLLSALIRARSGDREQAPGAARMPRFS